MKALIILCILLLIACNEGKNQHCYECTIWFTTTGSANDGTTESHVIKCDVSDEEIKEMERLAIDTIATQDGVTVTTSAECNKRN